MEICLEKVVERPALPADIHSLVLQMQTVLQQYGYRLNRMLPADASEPINLDEYADDAAAEAGGVEIGHLYRTGSAVKVRVT